MITLGLIADWVFIAIRPERVFLLLILASIGAALPLSSAWRELRKPRDDHPLDIDHNYSKDDRFFATSFEARVVSAIGRAPREPGPYAVVFRDPEVIDTIAGNITIEANREPESIVDVQGDLEVAAGAKLRKEALVGGSAFLRKRSSIRALKSEHDIHVGDDVTVERWIDAGTTVQTSPGANLGIRATALEAIRLSPGVTFKTLAAPRISVGIEAKIGMRPASHETEVVANIAGSVRHRIRADGALIVDESLVIPARAFCRGDVIARGDVTVGEGASLFGSIHGDRNVVLEPGAQVSGSIVAEKDVFIGTAAGVDQHVIAHGRATLHRSARVGTAGRITTLLADEAIEIAPEAVVFGRIVTYGLGRTVS